MTYWSRTIVACLSILVALGLVGCGFKLRGPVNLPFKTIAVIGSPFEQVVRDLKLSIRETEHIRVVDQIDQAEAVINVLGTERDDEILSVSATGRAQDYEYILTVTYRLCGAKGKVCQPDDVIEVRRDMTYNESQILAKQNEEQFLWRNMSKEVVRLILLRLSSLTKGMNTP